MSLSKYQYALLKLFCKSGFITEDDAAKYKQTTLGSFISRGYLDYSRSEGCLVITPAGYQAFQDYREAEILRRIESSVLSAKYYRLTGLKPGQAAPQRRRLRAVA